MDKIIEEIYSEVKQTITEKPSAEGIIILVTKLIPLIQKHGDKFETSQDKKQAVLELVRLCIRDSDDLNDDQKEYLTKFAYLTLPTTIDIMISLAKQEIDISKKVKNFKQKCCVF